MADLGFFDPNAVNDERELIAAGKYTAQITESDVVPTKAGTGSMLKLKWQIMGGPAQGRVLFDQINLSNPNAQAVQIGQQQLKRICVALGLGPIQNSAQLHLRPCMITVGVKDGDGQYGPQNVIKAYASLSGPAPTSANAPPPAGPAPANAPPPAGPAPANAPPPPPPATAVAGATRRPWE
jgi:hypothetical protein